MNHVTVSAAILLGLCRCLTLQSSVNAADPSVKPLFREFMGLNVHTVQFKPELYKPIAKHVRDYHPFNWDGGDETDYYPQFPFARNRVDWNAVYGSWKQAGYVTHVSVMFDDTPPEKWKNLPREARAYGFQFARYFGPSGKRLVESVEIGNEPGKYDDEAYRTLLQNVAEGIRKADPRLTISTCATFDRPSGDYHKSLSTLRGSESLYDVISVHSYAFVEGYPTWRRSFPEDPAVDFLKDIQKVIAWRNANAAGKPVWLTEFGWDAPTQPQATEGTFKDWVGVTDVQQAQYLVRALLVLSELDLERAYIYWFNDADQASVHASSGLTRNFEPKPSFHAVAHLFSTLGDYRFSRALRKEAGEAFVYEFTHETEPKKRVWAVWSPTGAERETTVTVDIAAGMIQKAERMPLAAGAAENVAWKSISATSVAVPASESPVFLWIED
ncbi:MAG: hypothetical protein H0T47_01635 [Planctomycetaceae bacterium]|nr:hypothetical protein [Planctomycetaceae bacterium]